MLRAEVASIRRHDPDVDAGEIAGFTLPLLLRVAGVGAIGVVIERTLLKHLYNIDPIYGLLLTFGLALIAEGIFRDQFGVSGQQYPVPELLQGATNLGFMILPNYRGWVVVASLFVCFGTWFLIERTRLGSYLRAGTENPALVQAFGVNVPLMVMLTYAGGAGLAAIAGVLAAPVIQITPLMGSAAPTPASSRARVSTRRGSARSRRR